MKKFITLILLIVVGFGGFYLYSYNETIHDFCVNKVAPGCVNAWNWVVDLFKNTKVPETPVEPEQPDFPLEPETPVNPGENEKPTEPEVPVNPVEPEQPETPVEPEQPVTPERVEMKVENSVNTFLNEKSIDCNYSNNRICGSIVVYFKEPLIVDKSIEFSFFIDSPISSGCYYCFLGKNAGLCSVKNNSIFSNLTFENVHYLIIPLFKNFKVTSFNLRERIDYNKYSNIEYEIVQLNNVNCFAGELLDLYNELNS